MIDKKVGRNDACPCGSGKKYKQCCLKKQDEARKTYTSSGKRKFKAKVLTPSSEIAGSVFQQAGTSSQGQVSTMENLKFKLTGHDFRVEGPSEKKSPFFGQQAQEEKKPTPRKSATSIPQGEFETTQEDFREKDDEKN